jgi:hypothetical protein
MNSWRKKMRHYSFTVVAKIRGEYPLSVVTTLRRQGITVKPVNGSLVVWLPDTYPGYSIPEEIRVLKYRIVFNAAEMGGARWGYGTIISDAEGSSLRPYFINSRQETHAWFSVPRRMVTITAQSRSDRFHIAEHTIIEDRFRICVDSQVLLDDLVRPGEYECDTCHARVRFRQGHNTPDNTVRCYGKLLLTAMTLPPDLYRFQAAVIAARQLADDSHTREPHFVAVPR